VGEMSCAKDARQLQPTAREVALSPVDTLIATISTT